MKIILEEGDEIVKEELGLVLVQVKTETSPFYVQVWFDKSWISK